MLLSIKSNFKSNFKSICGYIKCVIYSYSSVNFGGGFIIRTIYVFIIFKLYLLLIIFIISLSYFFILFKILQFSLLFKYWNNWINLNLNTVPLLRPCLSSILSSYFILLILESLFGIPIVIWKCVSITNELWVDFRSWLYISYNNIKYILYNSFRPDIYPKLYEWFLNSDNFDISALIVSKIVSNVLSISFIIVWLGWLGWGLVLKSSIIWITKLFNSLNIFELFSILTIDSLFIKLQVNL